MRKALLNDYIDIIKNTINQYFSNVENINDIVNSIFAYYEEMGDCTLIFYECNITADLLKSWIKKRAYLILPLVKNIYNNNDIPSIPSTKTVTRSANTNAYGAVEMQPLNSNLNEITSPTSKSKTGNTAQGNEEIISPDYAIKKIEFQYEFDTLYQLIQSTFLPMLEVYNRIY